MEEEGGRGPPEGAEYIVEDDVMVAVEESVHVPRGPFFLHFILAAVARNHRRRHPSCIERIGMCSRRGRRCTDVCMQMRILGPMRKDKRQQVRSHHRMRQGKGRGLGCNVM